MADGGDDSSVPCYLILTQDYHSQDGIEYQRGSLCVTSNDICRVEENARISVHFPNVDKTGSIPWRCLREIEYITHCLLLAITNKIHRAIVSDDEQWIEEGKKLQVCDQVLLFRKSNLPDEAKGILRYKGNIDGKGIYFGIELDSEHAGKGTSDGVFRRTQYFKCKDDCAVFVTLYNIRPNEVLQKVMLSETSAESRSSTTLCIDNHQMPNPSSRDHSVYTNDGIYEKIDKPVTAADSSSSMELYMPHNATDSSNASLSSFYNTKFPMVSESISPTEPVTSATNRQLSLQGPEDLPLKIGDRVVWISDSEPQRGVVRWIGGPRELDETELKPTAGVEFDKPVGKGTGRYKSRNLFNAKLNHAGLMPVIGLMKEKDFDKSSNEKTVEYVDNDSDLEKALALSLADNSDIRYPPVSQSDSFHGQGVRPKNNNSYIKTNIPILKSSSTTKFEIGSHVEVLQNPTRYGCIMWIGVSKKATDATRPIAGIAMEDRDKMCYSDGTFRGEKFFNAEPDSAFFIYLDLCRADRRCEPNTIVRKVQESKPVRKSNASLPVATPETVTQPNHQQQFEQQKQQQQQQFEQQRQQQHHQESSQVANILLIGPPVLSSENPQKYIGIDKGIEGLVGRSAMISILYAWFQFSSFLDDDVNIVPPYSKVIRLKESLANNIINPLRSNGYVHKEELQKLDMLLNECAKEVKYPFLDYPEYVIDLIAKATIIPPCIQLSNSTEVNYVTIKQNELTSILKLQIPTTQTIMGMTFAQKKWRLQVVPRIMHLWCQITTVIPSPVINVFSLIDGSQQICCTCKEASAGVQCNECVDYTQDDILTSTFMCGSCSQKKHNDTLFQDHAPVPVVRTHNATKNTCNMWLAAVICRIDKHFMCYVNTRQIGWLKFDSMAQQNSKGSKLKYVPEVSNVPDVDKWLSQEFRQQLISMKAEEMDRDLKTLMQNNYMCIYVKENAV